MCVHVCVCVRAVCVFVRLVACTTRAHELLLSVIRTEVRTKAARSFSYLRISLSGIHRQRQEDSLSSAVWKVFASESMRIARGFTCFVGFLALINRCSTWWDCMVSLQLLVLSSPKRTYPFCKDFQREHVEGGPFFGIHVSPPVRSGIQIFF